MPLFPFIYDSDFNFLSLKAFHMQVKVPFWLFFGTACKGFIYVVSVVSCLWSLAWTVIQAKVETLGGCFN